MKTLLIKNGTAVDVKSGTLFQTDIAVEGDRITRIAPEIGGDAVSTVDASGCLVTPGLIDHHAHLYPLAGIGIPAEAVCFASGVTTAVDAGSTGCRTYEKKRSFLAMTKLRIRSYLNVCSTGLDSLPVPEDVTPEHMEEEELKRLFEEYDGELLGLKIRTSRSIVREQGYGPLQAAVKLADRIGVPLMVHITDPPAPLDELLRWMRPGDIVTHMYQNTGFHLLTETGRLEEAAWKARERGVLFEAADARAHFSFEVSERAVQEGFLPDFIGTDLTKLSMYLRPTAFSMAMQVAKYCSLGISFPEVIKRCTWNQAVNMGLADEIGSLEEGKKADISIFRIREQENSFGDRPYTEPGGTLRQGTRLFQPVLTVKDGEMVYRDITF